MADIAPPHPKLALKRRHIAAATLGNALEFYDFLTYAFFSIQIGHVLFPVRSAYGSLMLSLATFGVGFVTRPLGALIIGSYADRVGRRPAMMLCFVLIGGSIVAMALIPPYARIGIAAPILAVIARMAQGFSVGGEVGSNTAFLMEAAPPGRRGLVVAFQAVSQNLALIVGGAVGFVLSALLTPAALAAYGWRIAFLLGAAAVPFGLWLRHGLPETLVPVCAVPVFAAPAAPPLSRGSIARAHWRVLLRGIVVIAAGTVSSYMFIYIVTYAQATLHLSPRAGFLAATIGYAVAIPGLLLGGVLSDRFGRRPVTIGGCLLLLSVIFPVFGWIVGARTGAALICGMAVLHLANSTIWGSFYAAFTESLPQAIRGSGFGSVYSLSVALFGGTTQLVVTWLIHVSGSPMAPAWYLSGATVIGLIGLLTMRESAPSQRPVPATAPASPLGA